MENKTDWKDALTQVLTEVETNNVRLGMDVATLRGQYFYSDLIAYLKGDDGNKGHIYFHELKPLYDKYGYEKVNRILLTLEEAKDGQDNE